MLITAHINVNILAQSCLQLTSYSYVEAYIHGVGPKGAGAVFG